ncbi:ATP synthase gamma chain [Bacteroidia bacterium]|nr:ATP synthase gamma chain [Bacteroidia bacterium]
MAAFKEIKLRINSVTTTRKITSAMKMVSAAKLNKAQRNIAGMLPYSTALHHVLHSLLLAEGDISTPLAVQRAPQRVAIVVFSSDSSLAGAFNSNVIKELRKAVQQYKHLPQEQVLIYTIGKKVFEAARKQGYTIAQNFEGLAPNPHYDTVSQLADELISLFNSKQLDQVEVIYQHFKNAGSQILTHEDFLPIQLSQVGTKKAAKAGLLADYILEPSHAELLAELLPKSLKLKLFAALLDSNASEHAARMIAMQTATDNANELVSDLTVEYNKSRQQAITNELLDIVGGSLK